MNLQALMTVINLPGYGELCQCFREEIQKMERDVFNTNPEKPEEVLAAHRIALGARWLFQRTMKRIETDIAKATAVETPPLTEKEKEELYLKSL